MPTVFEYQESPGVRRRATMTSAGKTGNGLFTFGVDPHWKVEVPGQGWSNDSFEYLTYLGTDGNQWKTKITTEGYLGSYSLRAPETKRAADGSFPNHNFEIVDWNSKKFRVAVSLINIRGAEATVDFTLTEI